MVAAVLPGAGLPALWLPWVWLSLVACLRNTHPARVHSCSAAVVLLHLQMFFQGKYLIPDPIANDVKYQASAQPFLVFGLLTTALAIGHVNHMA